MEEKEYSIDETLRAIEEKISGQNKEVKDGLDELKREMSKPKEDRQEKYQDDHKYSWLDSDEEIYMTKKEALTFQKMVIDQAKEIASASAKNSAKEIIESNTIRQSRDAEAFEEFPQLNEKSNMYNKDFAEAVIKEMDRRGAYNGPKQNDPDVLFDSASAVYSRFINQGKIKSKYMIEQELRESENQSASLNYRNTNGKGKSKKPNQTQYGLADTMQLSREYLDKYMENKQKKY